MVAGHSYQSSTQRFVSSNRPLPLPQYIYTWPQPSPILLPYFHPSTYSFLSALSYTPVWETGSYGNHRPTNTLKISEVAGRMCSLYGLGSLKTEALFLWRTGVVEKRCLFCYIAPTNLDPAPLHLPRQSLLNKRKSHPWRLPPPVNIHF